MIEREWREASDLRASRIGAGRRARSRRRVLRFWALGRGIPYAVRVDEPEIVERAVNMMKTGRSTRTFFDYPGLYIYIQLVVVDRPLPVGAIAGEWSSLDQASTDALLPLGTRGHGAHSASRPSLLVYRIGMRWGARHALLAAGCSPSCRCTSATRTTC